MNSDVISTIKDAENACNDKYAAEMEKSKAAIKNARVSAKAEAESKVLAYDEQCQKRLDDAIAKAQKEAQQLLEQNQSQCEALHGIANQNMQNSINYILGKVVG